MANIDDLFKASGVSSKRKLEPLRDPNEIYKSVRLSSNRPSSRHAHVEEAGDRDEDDTEAGPAPPPDDDENGDLGPAPPPEDDDFGGSGLTAQEEEALDYVDAVDPANDPYPTKFDSTWLRKAALNFEKRINKNAELRAKYENEPKKFIDSEADLDKEIKNLSILSEHPELYPEFVNLGSVASLVSLLTHENTDIAIDVVEIINELTDEDVEADEEQWNALVDALLEADLLGLLVSNFERLDEEQAGDQSGVYYALSIVENLCSGKADTTEKVVESDKLLRWLLRRIQVKEPAVSQNKQYAAEIIAILMQTSSKPRRKLASLDAVEVLLQLVSSYRKRDPEKGGHEEEYMENLFEALTSLADEPEGKAKFVEADGVELCLLMLKEGKRSKASTLRLLDHAVGGPGAAGVDVCQQLVKDGGLKTLFTLFMKKNMDRITTEHLISMFGTLLRLLPADSSERIRTLAKFVEKDYEKTAKLVKIRRDYAARLKSADEEIRAKQKSMGADEEDMKGELFLRRLDAGLFCLQTLDVVLAWLVAEDDGAKETIRKLLADQDETFRDIKDTLEEQLDGIEAENTEDKDPWGLKDMLSTLVEFLE
ncbi:DUF1716-domain-containing protein [Annulohypoxylon bovei var. microspora]|nr:DUF1716-domain-containing protein [Annulohypoxylon bovei var. microspora]